MMNKIQYEKNIQTAYNMGYTVTSSPYGHTAMARKGKWFLAPVETAEEAWLSIFEQLKLPDCKFEPYAQEYTLSDQLGELELRSEFNTLYLPSHFSQTIKDWYANNYRGNIVYVEDEEK